MINTKFFIISTILMTIFTILVYLGIIRYIRLLYCSPHKLIEKYKDKPKDKNFSNVVISFGLNPSQIKDFTPTLNSILDQSIGVNQIVINTKNDTKYNIPDFMKNICVFGKCGRDYGKAFNTVPTLLREEENDVVVISLKPNIIYGYDFIQTLLDDLHETKKPISFKEGICATTGDFKDTISNMTKQTEDDWFKPFLKGNYKEIQYNENYTY